MTARSSEASSTGPCALGSTRGHQHIRTLSSLQGPVGDFLQEESLGIISLGSNFDSIHHLNNAMNLVSFWNLPKGNQHALWFCILRWWVCGEQPVPLSRGGGHSSWALLLSQQMFHSKGPMPVGQHIWIPGEWHEAPRLLNCTVTRKPNHKNPPGWDSGE